VSPLPFAPAYPRPLRILLALLVALLALLVGGAR